jgi:pyridoxamine 5'-phosphate oxidase
MPARHATMDNSSMADWLADLRHEHAHGSFTDADADDDPFTQFRLWLAAAHTAGILQPNAMTLSTATSDGTPDARMVLLKGFDQRGFVFYTHRTSLKGAQLAANPRAALTFWWDAIERQVRVQGSVVWTSDAESDDYFCSRPRGSQLGAIVSPQSEVVADRAQLERALAELDARTGSAPPTRPSAWGGYRLIPSQFEFWQGRANRLHDRIRYRQDTDGGWIRERLAP